MSYLEQPEAEMACAWRDTAWAFVLSGSTEGEQGELLAHLLEGCEECGREITQARSVLGDLDLEVARETLAKGHGALPNDAIRARLLRGIQATLAAQPGVTTDALPPAMVESIEPTALAGIFVASHSDAGWQATPFPGIEFKVLLLNPGQGTATALVRMAPNAVYPAHIHAEREECFVISGDLSSGAVTLKAGDYMVADRGSLHPTHSTQAGCLMLITTSNENEFI